MIINDKHNAGIKKPNQLVSSNTKEQKSWQEDSLRYYLNLCLYNTSNNMKPTAEVSRNYAVMNAINDPTLLRGALDPLDLGVDMDFSEDAAFLAEAFYDIVDQPLTTLFGEELKRQFNPIAYVTSPDAINDKNTLFKERLASFLEEKISEYQNIIGTEQDPRVQGQELNKFKQILQEDLEKLDYWTLNNLQTAHEKMANQILQSLLNDPTRRTSHTFNEGWKDLILQGEEVLKVEPIGPVPVIKKVDLENFYVHGLGRSNDVNDGDAWVELEYLSVKRIIERFYKDLTKAQIKKLTDYVGEAIGDIEPFPVIAGEVDRDNLVVGQGQTSPLVRMSDEFAGEQPFITVNDGMNPASITDSKGNVRVATVIWTSYRKIGYLKYYDEFDAEQYMFVDEYYIPREELGEEVEYYYVNELFRGTLIHRDIIINVGPLEVQLRDPDNPALVKSPYIGRMLTTGNYSPRSVLDKILVYQHDFNIWMTKLKSIWVKNLGKLAVIDISKKPTDFSMEEWLTWMKTMGIVLENPLEENSEGMMVGNMPTAKREIDHSLATEIQQAISMLEWIKTQINEITGVNDPRQGDLTGKEGLGVTQQAIMQSSHRTENLFNYHDAIKVETLAIYLEYIKYYWKDNKEKRQYLLDGLSNHIMDFDGDLYSSATYGVNIGNSTELFQLSNDMQVLATQALQAGTITVADAAKIRLTKSPHDLIHKLEQSEKERAREAQEQQRMQQEAAQEALLRQEEIAQQQHQRDLEKMQLEYQLKERLELLKLQAASEKDAGMFYLSQDDNKDGVEDQVEIDKARIAQETKKLEIASKEKIEKQKLASQEKIARMNKSTQKSK